MELLDRVHLLEGAGPEGAGGVGVSEDLMNHNQKLESTISWLEVRGWSWRGGVGLEVHLWYPYFLLVSQKWMLCA